MFKFYQTALFIFYLNVLITLVWLTHLFCTPQNINALRVRLIISYMQCHSSRTLPPQNACRVPPNGDFKKQDFDIMAYPEAEWPSQQNILTFCFFPFHYFFSSTCGHNFSRTVARKSSIGGFMLVQGVRHSENLHMIHNTAFANSPN